MPSAPESPSTSDGETSPDRSASDDEGPSEPPVSDGEEQLESAVSDGEAPLELVAGDGETPLVSFVVPAYNEEEYLPRTLRSLKDLNTEVPYEIVVVDGDSDDDTAAVAEAYGATVVRQRTEGIGAARHEGAEAAGGEWLAFVDADTVVRPSYLDEMLDYVRDRGLVAASSRCRMDGPRRAKFPEAITNHVFPRSDRPILPGFNTFVRRDAYEAVGGYESVPNEDKALSRDLATVGPTGYHPDVLVEPSSRRVEQQGLVGMSLHYLRLDLRAIRSDGAGDHLGLSVAVTLWLAVVAGLLQFYHGLALGHATAALAGFGFVGGTLLFVMDLSRRRLLLLGIGFVAVQVAVWVAQGTRHGTFGAALYGLQIVVAAMFAYDYRTYRAGATRETTSGEVTSGETTPAK